jgi:guanyl-specific ribonuclease Sa
MLKKYTQLISGIIIGLLAGVFISKQFLYVKSKNADTVQVTTNAGNRDPDKSKSRNSPEKINSNTQQGDSKVPQKVLEVLKFVREKGKAMDGYVGGRIFSNREGQLPGYDENGNAMQYQEWDVNPKIEGRNRGTQRLITSRDGRAWYTSDHYRSFIEIK